MQRDFFHKSDGWLFYTLLCHGSFHKLKLSNLISIGSTLNHAVFTLEQINGGMSRLEQDGFIELKNDRVYLTKKGKLFYKVHKKRGELCISEQVRFSEIFSKIHLNTEVFVKDYFCADDYEKAIKNK